MNSSYFLDRLLFCPPLIFFLSSFFWNFVFNTPICFQTIGDVSVGKSGIRTISTVLGIAVATISSGSVNSATGYLLAFLILSNALSTVGSAVYTLDIGTGSRNESAPRHLLVSVMVWASRHPQSQHKHSQS